jgi:DNA-binding MarR family transcriptional regulator
MLVAIIATGKDSEDDMNLEVFQMIILIRKLCLASEEKIRKEFGLSSAEFGGILAMSPGERILCHDLSARMGLSASRGSRVVDRLMKKGCIEAQMACDDRRCTRIRLTRKGAGLKRKVEASMAGCQERILKGLPGRRRHQLVECLSDLATAMVNEQSKVQTG